MSFVEVLEPARTWAADHLPLAAGGLVAIAVLTFLWANAALRRRGFVQSPLDPTKLVASGPASAADEPALNWEPPAASFADRRRTTRRVGPPVPVDLSAPAFCGGVCEGYVIDRSTGGLKIATPVALAPGSTVQVRAADAPDTIGFVTLIVRNCRRTGDHYELGCEFDETPPWNVLLLFG